MTKESPEARLVRRCLEGNPEAIRWLVTHYQDDVFSLCVRLLRHRQDAEDVCQEVFLRVYRSLRTWDSSRPLRPWIMGIAVNRCKTWLMRKARSPEQLEYLQDLAAGPPPEDDFRELFHEIQLALGELREEYRAVFHLFHEEGQPYDAIARSMRRPVGTIKIWLHRARVKVLSKLRLRGMVQPEPLTTSPCLD